MILADGQFYILDIPSGIRDVAGNDLAVGPEMYGFKTQDVTPPQAYLVSPTGTGITLTPSTVRVQFNEDMHPGSFPGNATLVADDGTNVALALISYSSYNNQAYYQVNAPLQEYTEYTLSLQAGIQDEAGNGLTGTTDYNFRTLSTSEPHIVDYEFNSCPAQNKVNVKVTYAQVNWHISTLTPSVGCISGAPKTTGERWCIRQIHPLQQVRW